MRLPSAHSDDSKTTADFLADREGLSGASRATFLKVLQSTFGFELRHPRWAVTALGAWVFGVAVLGLFLERSRGWSLVSIFPWMSIVIFGATLIIALVYAEREPRRTNREFEWRAYCLLIRPVILAERPGLLDRNLQIDGRRDGWCGANPLPAVQPINWSARPINLWLPAAVGWGIGAVPLLLWQFLRGSELWIFGLPLVGSILLPLAWDVFRLSIYARVGKAVRELV